MEERHYEIEEERDSSEDFEITIDEEREEAPQERLKTQEGAELLEAYDVDIDSIADKPWTKPGADITDYFNYGFNEATWRQYSAKQKGLREEYKRPQERRPRRRSPERRWSPERRRAPDRRRSPERRRTVERRRSPERRRRW